jgi:ADP-ribosylglycohydrolase/catechol 2,3-dioxygenase-like lactoylglutathione lyase family enzyme
MAVGGMRDARSRDAAVGAALAFAIGDALGWPVEPRGNRVGGTKDLRPELALTSWARREGGRHAPHEESMPAGMYSDDTQLMLAVARSLRHEDWWQHLTRVELPWWQQYELGGGGAMRRAAQSWAKRKAPWDPGGAKGYWDAGGNGAAMRVLAHCAAGGDDFAEVRDRVLADGAATHGSPVALVGAQAYAYSLWLSLRRKEPLGWGQLLSEVLGAVEEWARIDPAAAPMGWAQAAPDDYAEQWARTVEGFTERLSYARNQMAHGALAIDDDVLRDLGCFSAQSGAGTVTAAGALYLASRHAAEPAQGLLRAAFARGADTDTLASMTGALLGAVHGPDWLGAVSEQLVDADLIRRTAADFERGDQPAGPAYEKGDQRLVEEKLARALPRTEGALPFYGKVAVIEVRDLDNRLSRIRSWWLKNTEGQTFRIKRTSRAQRAPWIALPKGPEPVTPDATSPPQPNGRVRSGLVVRVADLERAREFYEQVIGLPVSRKTSSAVVLSGWLALETSHPQAGGGQEILVIDTSRSALAVTLYTDADRFSEVCRRLEQAHVRFTVEESDKGQLVRTADPDGTPVEIRLVV